MGKLLWFFCGVFAGTIIGIFFAALCAASKQADERAEAMMTVINREKERVCRDCQFHKVIMGVIPKHYCAAALPDEEWLKKCPLKGEENEESV